MTPVHKTLLQKIHTIKINSFYSKFCDKNIIFSVMLPTLFSSDSLNKPEGKQLLEYFTETYSSQVLCFFTTGLLKLLVRSVLRYPLVGSSSVISWMLVCCHCVVKKASELVQIISGKQSSG